jgi:hypothetical protein
MEEEAKLLWGQAGLSTGKIVVQEILEEIKE